MKRSFWFVFLVFPLFAQEMEERITALEAQMEQIGEQTASSGYGARFASDSFSRGAVGIDVFGELLYWNSNVGGTDYVYKLVNQARGGEKGGEERQSFDWGVGYRLGAGIHIPLVSWEVVGTYTHYGSQDRSGRGTAPPSLLINLKGINPSSQKVTSSYKIDYDDAVLELKRTSFLSRLLGLGTTVGVKQSWIDQVQAVTYESGQQNFLKVKDRCRFSGIGPRIGIKAKWHLLFKVSLLADVAAALQYGEFEVKHTENQVDLKGNAQIFSPSVDFFIGLQWDCPKDWFQFSLRLGYEAEYFWRFNQSIEIENQIGTGNAVRLQLIRYADDLTFYGMTFRAALEF